jgi:hypothetical protein
MSIRQEWQKLVADEVLFKLGALKGDPSRRTVLMTKEVSDLVSEPWGEGDGAIRRAILAQSLQHFVSGRRIVVCMEPFAARKAHVGRLSPVEDSVFDIRCQESPALRIFCRVIERDVLLAVTCRPRSIRVPWLSWLPLGDRNSKEWKAGVAAVKREWPRYFPAHEPVRGDNVNDYFSRARLERAKAGT